MSDPERFKGSVYALLAYGAWGFSPMFWKQVSGVPALETLGHRVIWALLVFFLLLRLRGRAGELPGAIRDPRTRRAFALAAGLIAFNWCLYVYAVSSSHIVESSLGYFINPLLNVALGMIFLGERLRTWQWVAVALAAAGVIQMSASGVGVPWIALGLALSFGLYGLVRKTAPVDALLGSNLETLLLLPVAVIYLGWLFATGRAGFLGADTHTRVFLVASGLMTALPLLWFSNAARRLPLKTLGFFQYLAPTCQLLLGVLVYGEPFTGVQLKSFAFIWTALVLFTAESQWHRRRTRRAVV
ncbi:MAG: EamA family transporter RarD [Acidobacteria bacterium]|nr:EamA family transporter RarD [Acidobacteriota bacterium]